MYLDFNLDWYKDTSSIPKDAQRGKFWSGLKNFGKGFGIGMAVDTAAGEAVQYNVDHGNFRTANALAAGSDVVSGVYGTIMGAGAYLVGAATNSPTIKNWGANTVDASGQSIANAVVHTEAAINGDNNVYAKTKGGNTALGDLFGYGSLSQQAGIPQHAQTAFSTPMGYNTMQSAGGYAYNADTTATVSQVDGGFASAMMSEQKQTASISATKMGKFATEHAINDYIQNVDMLDAIKNTLLSASHKRVFKIL